jgi:SAM-dependent methyltransferase
MKNNMKFCLPSNKVNYDWVSLLRSYRKYVTKTATVLEIGASSIERTKELCQWCHKLIGVELLPERKPNDFNNVQYLLGDWQHLSEFIQPKSIDVAVSSHVIEHIPDDLKAINELYTVLRQGGVALLNTPNRKRLIRAVVEMFTGERKFPFGEHQREYVEKDLLDLLEASHFRKFQIIPVVFGIHGGPVFLYSESVPKHFRKFANFWEIHLFKE